MTIRKNTSKNNAVGEDDEENSKILETPEKRVKNIRFYCICI